MENHFNCIYLYTNKVNGKKYIGQAVDFERRHKQHIYSAYNENNNAYDCAFHCAIRKHGIENFEIEILIENLQNQEELNYWECYYIVEFNTLAKNQKGYNLASGGNNGNPLAGKTDEELAERSRKISEAHKGKNPYAGKTEEELAEIHRKRHETMKNKSEEEMKEISKKWHETMSNKSEEEKKEIRRKQSEAYHNKSDKELAEIRRKQSEANKEKYKGEKNPRARKIIQVDPLTKQPVFTWQYVKQATDFFSISRGALKCYLKGKTKSGHLYNGFLWYYLDEYEQLTK